MNWVKYSDHELGKQSTVSMNLAKYSDHELGRVQLAMNWV